MLLLIGWSLLFILNATPCPGGRTWPKSAQSWQTQSPGSAQPKWFRDCWTCRKSLCLGSQGATEESGGQWEDHQARTGRGNYIKQKVPEIIQNLGLRFPWLMSTKLICILIKRVWGRMRGMGTEMICSSRRVGAGVGATSWSSTCRGWQRRMICSRRRWMLLTRIEI